MASFSNIDLLKLSPSALLLHALYDFRRCEFDPEYSIRMSTWHSAALPGYNEPCAVCLAGSVMAKSLGASKDSNYTPMHFGADIENVLIAVNCFRTGQIRFGLGVLGYDPVPKHIVDHAIASWHSISPEKFMVEMMDIYHYLRRRDTNIPKLRGDENMTRPDYIDLTRLSPSALLLHALNDFKRCEFDPEYKIRMSTWHSASIRTYDEPCAVCLAGSVMAKSLGVLKTENSHLHFPHGSNTNIGPRPHTRAHHR